MMVSAGIWNEKWMQNGNMSYLNSLTNSPAERNGTILLQFESKAHASSVWYIKWLCEHTLSHSHAHTQVHTEIPVCVCVWVRVSATFIQLRFVVFTGTTCSKGEWKIEIERERKRKTCDAIPKESPGTEMSNELQIVAPHTH